MNIAANIADLVRASKPIWSDNVSYTKKPNIVFDSVMSQVSGNAYKCLDVIVRCTLGYHKPDAQISESAFMKLTGIKRKETLRTAIRELEQIQIISVSRDNGVTNTFVLTTDQYEKLALNQSEEIVPALKNSTGTRKPSDTSTENSSQTSTKKPSPNKENLKENIKENNNNAKPKFDVQKNVMAGYVTYFQNDSKFYSLQELELNYDVNSDFLAQAEASYPSLNLSIDHFSTMFTEMRQWSLTTVAGMKQPQQWMNTWLNWIKNNSYRLTVKPKQQSKPSSSRNVNDAWASQPQYQGPVEHIEIPEDFV